VYPIWIALFNGGVNYWLAVKIGRPLVPLNVGQEPGNSWPALKADDDAQMGVARWGNKRRPKTILNYGVIE
jgi:hypothetical protein